MPNQDWNDFDIAYHKFIKGDCVQSYFRYSGIFSVCKRIGKFPDDDFLRHLICKNVHWLPTEKIKCSYVIEACYMIFMRMGKDDRIELLHISTKHLVPEI